MFTEVGSIPIPGSNLYRTTMRQVFSNSGNRLDLQLDARRQFVSRI